MLLLPLLLLLLCVATYTAFVAAADVRHGVPDGKIVAAVH